VRGGAFAASCIAAVMWLAAERRGLFGGNRSIRSPGERHIARTATPGLGGRRPKAATNAVKLRWLARSWCSGHRGICAWGMSQSSRGS
jgi:hypothetical protein